MKLNIFTGDDVSGYHKGLYNKGKVFNCSTHLHPVQLHLLVKLCLPKWFVNATEVVIVSNVARLHSLLDECTRNSAQPFSFLLYHIAYCPHQGFKCRFLQFEHAMLTYAGRLISRPGTKLFFVFTTHTRTHTASISLFIPK